MAWDVERMLAFDDEYRRLAAEDSIPSVAILMGALDGLEVRPRLLASEGPWGVGYMTALVEIGAAKDRGEPRAEAAVVPGLSRPRRRRRGRRSWPWRERPWKRFFVKGAGSRSRR